MRKGGRKSASSYANQMKPAIKHTMSKGFKGAKDVSVKNVASELGCLNSI